MGTEYLPRLNSAGWNEFLLTVTRSKIGIRYEEYSPVAVRENKAPRTVGFVKPGMPEIRRNGKMERMNECCT